MGKCGDVGDSNFDHTWVEGLQSCKETTASPVTSGCPKCGTNKAGKQSCCSRGGTWFGKCGDVGDSNFDHTWVDGLRSCSNPSPGQGKAKRQEGAQETVVYKQNTIRQADTGSDTDAGVIVYANSGGQRKLTGFIDFILFVYTALIILN